MSPERARATWTDERLDDLSRRMDAGFDRVDADLRSLRTELGARIETQGAELSARIDGLGQRIDGVGDGLGHRIDGLEERFDARMDALQHTLLQVGGGMIAAFLVAAAGLIATQL